MTTTIDQVGRSDTGSPARAPDEQGIVTRDGVRIHWERYGAGAPAILLLPSWSIVHSRMWKGQIPYLARHASVITFDGRGNGLSDRPAETSAYGAIEYVEDAAAVLDAAGIEQACVVGLSLGGLYAALFAGRNPERMLGAAILSPTIPFLVPPGFGRDAFSFDAELETDEGWAKFNRHFWLRDYRGFLEFFFGEMFPEAHSTKQIEDGVAWGLDTDAETLIATRGSTSGVASAEEVEALLRGLRCPVVVIHGTDDHIVAFERGVRVAELTGGELVRLEGSGHAPAGPRSGAGQPGVARPARARQRQAARRRARGRARSTAPSERCSSPPRSASVTHGATLRSRTSCDARCRASRSSGSPRSR